MSTNRIDWHDPETAGVPPQAVLIMQIISGALAMGLVFFLVVVAVMTNGFQAPGQDSNFLAAIMAMLALGPLAASLVVPQFVGVASLRSLREAAANGTESPERIVSELTAVYQTRLIVGQALREGPGMIGATGVLVTHEYWLLAIPVLAIALILLHTPTKSRVEHFIESQLLQQP